MQVALKVPDDACSKDSQLADFASLVSTSEEDDACVEAEERHWDVCVLNDRIYATIHDCTPGSGRVHEYSRQGQLLRTFRSELFNEPSMMDLCY